MKKVDMVGQRFGRLEVIERHGAGSMWRCVCDCGTEKIVRGGSLTSGNTRSCGCLTKENPGRPAQPKMEAFISLAEFLNEAIPSLLEIKRILKTHNVVVDKDANVYMNGEKYGPYPSIVVALCEAMRRAVKTSDLDRPKPKPSLPQSEAPQVGELYIPNELP